MTQNDPRQSPVVAGGDAPSPDRLLLARAQTMLLSCDAPGAAALRIEIMMALALAASHASARPDAAPAAPTLRARVEALQTYPARGRAFECVALYDVLALLSPASEPAPEAEKEKP